MKEADLKDALADEDLEEVLYFEPTRVLKSQTCLFLAISEIFVIKESLMQFFSMPAVPRHFDVLCGVFILHVLLRMPPANACCCHRAEI